jgi:RNA-directed DNA polymerase
MMHAHEKSDSAIVAGKPMNKAERSATESVEPRAETKGNAHQQSTHRTQSRVSVTQALERVRKAASKSKQEKFTALFHHLSIEHLEAAFFELQENAAAGVDGLTWRAYEVDLERNLEELHSRLHRGAYRPLPARMSASNMKFTFRLSIASMSASIASCASRPGRNPYENPRKSSS